MTSFGIHTNFLLYFLRFHQNNNHLIIRNPITSRGKSKMSVIINALQHKLTFLNSNALPLLRKDEEKLPQGPAR